ANVHQITRSIALENQISLMPDGRVLYSRWDYVDRNFSDGHGFWACNPDGTNQALIWGNNTTHPSTGWTARFIPRSGRLLCILGVHHGSLGGALAILDPRKAIEGLESIVRTWPVEVKDEILRDRENSLEEEPEEEVDHLVKGALQNWSPKMRHLWSTEPNMRFHQYIDALRGVEPWYNTPWPLSEKYFLCVRAEEREAPPAIYLVDIFGNELMVHKEGAGCFSPMPLAPSSRPLMIPSRRDYGNGDGFFYIQDVYEGTHMQGIARGTVKAVRVVETISKRGLANWVEWNGGGSPGVAWRDFNAKQILGTASVEEDGSAYFAVPSDRFAYFQLLDEDGMMVQTMRSGTSVHSGETLSCVGCHESRHTASPSAAQERITLASQRPPEKLRQWYGPSRPFNYAVEIQPVLDKHCVDCHDYGKEGAKEIVLSGDKTASFNVSYMELWRKGYVGGLGAGPAGNLPPKIWGSHTSKLAKLLREGHKNVKLDAESMDRLISWIDINGPYYPTAYCAYPSNPPGRNPLKPEETEILGELSGFSFDEIIAVYPSKGPLVNFTRPELSPCLNSLSKDSEEYREALALIRKGHERLKKRPRADMPGFVPWERDLTRMAHRKKYNEIELNSRLAIREGTLRYEPDQDVYKEIEVEEE
ncbi:MAG: HzsA-related protein, partial [Planctomycetota bacterium]